MRRGLPLGPLTAAAGKKISGRLGLNTGLEDKNGHRGNMVKTASFGVVCISL
jgi:hypothetical protein